MMSDLRLPGQGRWRGLRLHAVADAGSRTGAARQSKRVLIVEDEALVALEFQDMVEDLGYEVIGIAATGEAAQRLAAADRPDIVLMDVRIQGAIDGIETARALRAAHAVPVVFLTGSSDAPTMQRINEFEPAGRLIKPVRARDLAAMLDVALGHS